MTKATTSTTTTLTTFCPSESESKVSNGDSDPVIRQFREKISDNDLKLVDILNKRLKLVAQLRDYKQQQGVDFYDAEREARRAGREAAPARREAPAAARHFFRASAARCSRSS